MADSERENLANLKDEAASAMRRVLSLEKQLVQTHREIQWAEEEKHIEELQVRLNQLENERKTNQEIYSNLVRNLRPEAERIRADLLQEYLVCLEQTYESDHSEPLQAYIEAKPSQVNTGDFVLGPVDFQVYNPTGNTLYISGGALESEQIQSFLPQTGGLVKKYNNRNFIVYRNPSDEVSSTVIWLWNCAIRVNRRYHGEYEPRSYNDETRGILGITMSCTLPSWMNNILQQRLPGFLWDPTKNPRVLKDGRYLFRIETMTYEATNRVIQTLKTVDPERFSAMFPQGIYVSKVEEGCGGISVGNFELSQNLLLFLETENYTCATVSWDNHARVLLKDYAANKIWLVDPWMTPKETKKTKEFRALALYLREQRLSLTPVVRETVDQWVEEGSCQAFTLIRLCLIAEYGYIGGLMPIPCEYAILIQRLAKTEMNQEIFLEIPMDFAAVYDTIPKLQVDRFTEVYAFERYIPVFIGLFARDYPTVFEATIQAINASEIVHGKKAAVQLATGLVIGYNAEGLQRILQEISLEILGTYSDFFIDIIMLENDEKIDQFRTLPETEQYLLRLPREDINSILDNFR